MIDGYIKIRGHTLGGRTRSTNLEDPGSYELCVGDEVYMESTSPRTRCGFAIDTLLANFINEAGQTGPEIMRARSSK